MMSALRLSSTQFSKLWILLDGDLCKYFYYLYIFSLFLVFKHDFIRFVDFTRIASLSTASDDVTN